jgi:ABC-type cobalamin/Fe3+-siderophores transport system ATPase subunit
MLYEENLFEMEERIMADELVWEAATEKPGGYISKIQFNNGKSIDIKQNDIVIFVGPNNAGKSQSLKDIYVLSQEKKPSVVVSDISITKSRALLSSFVENIAVGDNHGSYKSYSILGFGMNVFNNTDTQFPTTPAFGEYRDLFIANLDTSARLSICNPANNIARNAAKQHPIHYAAFTSKYRKWLSDNFKKEDNKARLLVIEISDTMTLGFFS